MKPCRKFLSLLLSLSLLLGLAGTAAFSVSAADDAALTDADFLSVNAAGQVVNTAGEVVKLRGVNLGNWLIQETWMAPIEQGNGVADQEWGMLNTLDTLEERFGFETAHEIVTTYQQNYITEYDLDIIAATGSSVVRVPFWYRNFYKDTKGTWINQEPDGSVNLDENTGFQMLDWVIEECGKRGLYVILDMHGAPGGQSTDHCCGTPYTMDLYTSEECQASMQKLWEEIARRYQGNPTVAVYDIMNEPMNNTHTPDRWQAFDGEIGAVTGSEEGKQAVFEVYDRMYKAIRAIDPDHIVSMEGIWRLEALPDPREVGWTNVMYQCHFYDDLDKFKSLVAYSDELCEEYGVALLIGEFHTGDGGDDRLDYMNQLGVHWTTWTYKTANGTVSDAWHWYKHENIPQVNLFTDSAETMLQKWGTVLQTQNGFVRCRTADEITNSIASDVPPPPGEVLRYEAESGETCAQAVVQQNDGNFSNSGYVGELNTITEIEHHSQIADDWSNIPYVKLTVTAPESGWYNVQVGYACERDISAYIRSNDQSSPYYTQVIYPSTGSWNRVRVKTVQVPLEAGENTLWLSGAVTGTRADNWINFDYVDVYDANVEDEIEIPGPDLTPAPPDPGEPTRFEAETVERSSQAVVESGNNRFSNGGFVGQMNTVTVIDDPADIAEDWSNVPYIRLNVTAETAGLYQVVIGYATDTGPSAYIRVNDQPAAAYTRVTFPSSGGWDSTNTLKLQLRLEAGENTLWISGAVTDGGWVNYDFIDVYDNDLSTSPGFDRELGDVNGDGVVNSSDARLVLQHSVELIQLTGDSFTYGDIDGSGSLNSSDARYILQKTVS